jgi:hypothetical protein
MAALKHRFLMITWPIFIFYFRKVYGSGSCYIINTDVIFDFPNDGSKKLNYLTQIKCKIQNANFFAGFQESMVPNTVKIRNIDPILKRQASSFPKLQFHPKFQLSSSYETLGGAVVIDVNNFLLSSYF